ncbi:class I SAM-dependent methyltransferase [Rheinheimera maricola]|uniref:Class I SAM-dependent methyltransferase n=1 Tax=Rheinheimera maricola TaxID=2793282 RepID=A0ABS7XBR7_9GAMM|nr:class I SAM-dependent methyltransferase [Rheinheimera maricola]MBZ9612998.1 class I SAM-dependent methyltransferase [Rheinheimera maricola]
MSNTSLLICAGQCWPDAAAMEPASVSQQLAQQALLHSGWRGRLLLRLLGKQLGRVVLNKLLQYSLPGILAHYQWRKQYIAGWVQQAIEQEGIQQLLIIGAGYDGLGTQLSAQYSQLQVIEIDRPSTMALKQAVLQRLQAMPVNLTLLPADLSCCSLPQLLQQSGVFVPKRSTLVLAEGVLMYLPSAAIGQLLQQLRQCVTAPLQLIASQMQLDWQGKPRFSQQRWLADLALLLSAERFSSGVVPAALNDWLAGHGFSLQHLAQPQLHSNPDPCPGELLFRAAALPHCAA